MRFSLPQSDREERFTEWLSEYAAIPVKLSRAYAAEAAAQGELHQEMLVQVWRSLAHFDGAAKASTWIYRVCLNTALTWKRGRDRRGAHEVAAPEAVDASVAGGPGPAEAHERADLMEVLLAAVRELPPSERSLVVLSLDGLSYREIGEVTGMTENHVGVALTRVRAKLANILKGVSHEL
jgi:RNA polymerase sigma-70 factor (ECF subfamily)